MQERSSRRKKSSFVRLFKRGKSARGILANIALKFTSNSDTPFWKRPARGDFFIFLFVLFGAAPLLAAETKSADAIIDSLQKNYDATTDFTADFQQETDVKSLNRSLKASGKLFFKRPGKMLWRYTEPKGEFALADGKNLYFYQPEQNQVIKSPLKNAFRSDVPLSFLLGLGNLKKDFNATLQGSDDKQYTLRLEPKNENGGFNEVLLGVAKPSYDVISVSVRDATGNLTTIRLSQLRKGVGVKDSLFTLEIPKGADVVELGQ
ncbi:MAG TPA: outer membrane lipoprotein chaperone LolA [Candidatus Binatia bacterium]|jgi:outer membrane lipoprotein carrier protein